ncbi:MAG: PmbA/TldA family metallopeptidase, partial [Acidimicrobiales bacterium]
MTAAASPLVEPGVVERALAHALRHGGDFAEVFVEDKRSTAISLDDRRVEELSSGHDKGAGIRVVSGETTGFAHTADLSERGLLAAAEAAAAVARSNAPGARQVELGDRRLVEGTGAEILPEDIGKAAKVDLLRRADDAARSTQQSIVQVSAGYGDSRRRILVASSEGLLASDDQVRTRFSVVCVASGDSGMQTGYESRAHTVGFELFDRFS